MGKLTMEERLEAKKVRDITEKNKRTVVKKEKIDEEKIEKTTKVLNPSEKREEKKLKYNRQYHKDNANVKLSKAHHVQAKKNAKTKYMSIKRYLEFLIDKDTEQMESN